MSQKQVERRSLTVSCLANLIFTGLGLWAFLSTRIQALFLDCFFSFLSFFSCIMALTISKVSQKRTKHYPDGLYFLEPLYAIMKSLSILFLLVISVFSTGRTAWTYFEKGTGSPLITGPVVPYAITMMVICFGLGFFNQAQNKKINRISTILTAESRSNFIDGLQSGGIGIAVLLLNTLDINGPYGFLHYTGDFFITTALSLFSLKEPVKVLLLSFRELSGGTINDKKIEKAIRQSVASHIGGLLPCKNCYIYKTGMHIRIYLYLAGDCKYEELHTIREKILAEVHVICETAEIVFCR